MSEEYPKVLKKAEMLRVETEFFVSQGYTLDSAAPRLGYRKAQSLRRQLERKGFNDLAKQLTANGRRIHNGAGRPD